MATEEKTLRTAIIGLGGMGQGHCKRIRELVPEMELTAVCDTHGPTAEAAGKDTGVPHFTSHQELIEAVSANRRSSPSRIHCIHESLRIAWSRDCMS